jgi:hypothetical protein
MEVANTLAYYDTATITDMKRFIVQAPGGQFDQENLDIHSLTDCIYAVGH